MATFNINLGEAGLSPKALIRQYSDRSKIWTGASFVAISTLTDAQYAAAAIDLTAISTSETATGSYLLTMPAVTEKAYIEIFSTTVTVTAVPFAVEEYDPNGAATAAEVADAVLDELLSAHTTTGSLSEVVAAIKTAVDALSIGTGDGAYTVTITVVDQDDAAVENAFVRVTLGATSYTSYTDADGEVSFSCDAGTWTVGITAPAYTSFTPTSLVITDDTEQEYSLTAATSTADTFAEAQDLYDMFGEDNVKEWANSNSLASTDPSYTTEIARRITAALEYGTEEVKEFLRFGPYEEEFTTVPTTIKRCTCYKAGAWLFEWRRDTEENDRYSMMEKRADTILEQIKRGARQLDSSVQTVKGTRVPGVV